MYIFIFCIIYVYSTNGELHQSENEIPKSAVVDCGNNFQNNLLSGSNTVLGEHPWIALIGYENIAENRLFYACTGSLINNRYILTSAICLATQHIHQTTRLSHVRLGEYNIISDLDCFATRLNPCVTKSQSVDVGVDDLITHPNFDSTSPQSDNIALIRLNETIIFEDYHGLISPICLSSAGINPKIYFENRFAEVVGWDFGSGHPNDVLMREFLPYVGEEVCENLYKGFKRNKQLCMMSERIRKRCVGDSGSPLILAGPHGPPFLQIGILSYGPLICGFSKSPTVFTSISYYRKWIDENIH